MPAQIFKTSALRHLAFISVALLLPTLVLAEPGTLCGKRDAMIVVLSLQHGETLTGRGLMSDAALFEVWHSADSGSWTILRTSADGQTCVMAAGTHWMPGAMAGIPGQPG